MQAVKLKKMVIFRTFRTFLTWKTVSNKENCQNLQKSLLETLRKVCCSACLIDFRFPFRCQEESAGLPGC